MTSKGQGPLNDPRLVERRGDLSGFSAFAFLVLVLAGFAVVTAALFVLMRPGGLGGLTNVSPSPAPTAAPTPSRAPTPSPTPSTAPSPTIATGLITVAVGAPADVIVAGTRQGIVTVRSAKIVQSIAGQRAPAGSRWLLASVEYQAVSTLTYDANRWFALDKTGKRHAWRGVDPDPSLGHGSLEATEKVDGNITFQVPAKSPVSWLVLTDASGNDVVLVKLP